MSYQVYEQIERTAQNLTGHLFSHSFFVLLVNQRVCENRFVGRVSQSGLVVPLSLSGLGTVCWWSQMREKLSLKSFDLPWVIEVGN